MAPDISRPPETVAATPGPPKTAEALAKEKEDKAIADRKGKDGKAVETVLDKMAPKGEPKTLGEQLSRGMTEAGNKRVEAQDKLDQLQKLPQTAETKKQISEAKQAAFMAIIAGRVSLFLPSMAMAWFMNLAKPASLIVPMD